MLSTTCVLLPLAQRLSCVKNLTVFTAELCFLRWSVEINKFLTQFVFSLFAAMLGVFTSLIGCLCTLTTAPTTNTIYLFNFYYYCS